MFQRIDKLTKSQAADLLATFHYPQKAEIEQDGYGSQFVSNPDFMSKPYVHAGYIRGDDLIEVWLCWEGISGIDDCTVLGQGYSFDVYSHEVKGWQSLVTIVREHLRELASGEIQ